jgi:hypothetical protein
VDALGDVSADSAQPTGKPVGPPETVQLAASDGKRLLGGVLGQMTVGQHTVGYPHQSGIVTPVKLAEAVHVTAPGRFDQFGFRPSFHASSQNTQVPSGR